MAPSWRGWLAAEGSRGRAGECLDSLRRECMAEVTGCDCPPQVLTAESRHGPG